MHTILLFALLSSAASLRAQEASLAEADLDFSRDIVKHYHLAVRVALETKADQYTNYQYDHYPQDGPYHGAERIKADEGVFARRAGGQWLKSDDWGETGTPAEAGIVDELNTYVDVANIAFEKPHNRDASQGKNVWKFIEKTGKNDITYFTYERTREHPHPNGVSTPAIPS